MAFVCGIDEAGRGPVMGPMVIAGVKTSSEKELEKLGVKDSKKLQPQKREKLYDEILKIADDYVIILIEPEEIDQQLSSPSMNLNWLEAVKTVEILQKLGAETAYIDCPAPTASKYKDYIKNKLDCPPQLFVEHKADDKFPVCAAASILAKVTRDREIKKLQDEYGDIGSGYPADPKTKGFLEENSHLPVFRRSWGTWQTVNSQKGQKKLFNF